MVKWSPFVPNPENSTVVSRTSRGKGTVNQNNNQDEATGDPEYTPGYEDHVKNANNNNYREKNREEVRGRRTEEEIAIAAGTKQRMKRQKESVTFAAATANAAAEPTQEQNSTGDGEAPRSKRERSVQRKRRPSLAPEESAPAFVYVLQDATLAAALDDFNASAAFLEPCEIRLRTQGVDFFVHRRVFDLHGRGKASCLQNCDQEARILVDLKKPVDQEALVTVVQFMYSLELRIETGDDDESFKEALRRLKEVLMVAEVFQLETVQRASVEWMRTHLLGPESATALLLWLFLDEWISSSSKSKDNDLCIFESLKRDTAVWLRTRLDDVIEMENFFQLEMTKMARLVKDLHDTDETGGRREGARIRGKDNGVDNEWSGKMVEVIVNWVNYRRHQRKHCVEELLKEARLGGPNKIRRQILRRLHLR